MLLLFIFFHPYTNWQDLRIIAEEWDQKSSECKSHEVWRMSLNFQRVLVYKYQRHVAEMTLPLFAPDIMVINWSNIETIEFLFFTIQILNYEENVIGMLAIGMFISLSYLKVP